MVLCFALWGDPEDGSIMTWLDNPPNGPCPDAYKNPDPEVSGYFQ